MCKQVLSITRSNETSDDVQLNHCYGKFNLSTRVGDGSWLEHMLCMQEAGSGQLDPFPKQLWNDPREQSQEEPQMSHAVAPNSRNKLTDEINRSIRNQR